MTGLEVIAINFGMFTESAGVTRTPSRGSDACAELRMVIQSVADLTGKEYMPWYIAPAWRVMVSPG